MKDSIDYLMTLTPASEDKKQKIQEDCKTMAELFEAASSEVFDCQEGLVFHIEFDKSEKLGAFLEYLRAHGLLRIDEVHVRSESVN